MEKYYLIAISFMNMFLNTNFVVLPTAKIREFCDNLLLILVYSEVLLVSCYSILNVQY